MRLKKKWSMENRTTPISNVYKLYTRNPTRSCVNGLLYERVNLVSFSFWGFSQQQEITNNPTRKHKHRGIAYTQSHTCHIVTI